MSVSFQSRRLARSATCLLPSHRQPRALPLRSLIQSRGLVEDLKDPKTMQRGNPFLKQYRRQQEAADDFTPDQVRPETGKLQPESLFMIDHEREVEKKRAKDRASGRRSKQLKEGEEPTPLLSERSFQNMQPVLDPNPVVRRQWLRKMVIQSVQKRGRLTKAELLAQTERKATAASIKWETSTKKLLKLANQIQGKTIEEAKVQMRFSKKKYGLVISRFLDEAYNKAVVQRGMGLGKAEGRTGEPVEIQLKDGKRKKITDRTDIYIQRAFVGRGKYEKEPEYRAKGRVNILRHPTAMLTVDLREEATRIREHADRQTKRDNRKLWVHLPDRPVTTQRQYCLW